MSRSLCSLMFERSRARPLRYARGLSPARSVARALSLRSQKPSFAQCTRFARSAMRKTGFLAQCPLNLCLIYMLAYRGLPVPYSAGLRCKPSRARDVVACADNYIFLSQKETFSLNQNSSVKVERGRFSARKYARLPLHGKFITIDLSASGLFRSAYKQ